MSDPNVNIRVNKSFDIFVESICNYINWLKQVRSNVKVNSMGHTTITEAEILPTYFENVHIEHLITEHYYIVFFYCYKSNKLLTNIS